MRFSRFLLLCACLLAAPLAGAHEGHEHKAKPADKGSTGKPEPRPGRTALAEAESNQRFCMKNKEGKVHCIPFGPH